MDTTFPFRKITKKNSIRCDQMYKSSSKITIVRKSKIDKKMSTKVLTQRLIKTTIWLIMMMEKTTKWRYSTRVQTHLTEPFLILPLIIRFNPFHNTTEITWPRSFWVPAKMRTLPLTLRVGKSRLVWTNLPCPIASGGHILIIKLRVTLLRALFDHLVRIHILAV